MTADAELFSSPIARLSGWIRSKRLSPVDLVEAHLHRIATLDPMLDAFITVTAELARSQARTAEREIMRGRWRGPLHGIPFGLKDIYDTRGILTSGHSRISIDRRPDADAATVRRLYDAGAVLVGKLATHEFAHGGPSFDLPWPPARNPWNLAHFTGGSSSGSGAAVAAGLVPGALGSDTGGSIRGPACLCGVVGFMGTSGLVSRHGIIPNSYTLDRAGPLARTVEDTAILMQAIAGFDPRDRGSIEAKVPDLQAAAKRPVRGMRVGVLRYVWEDELEQPPEVRAAMDAAIDVFQRLGVHMEDLRLRSMREYNDVKVVIAESELLAIHGHELARRPRAFGEDFLTRVLPACLFSGADVIQASRQQSIMIDELRQLGGRFDALLCCVLGPAPRLDAHDPLNFWRRPNAQPFANVTGAPAIALPNGFTASGLPLGMQLIGLPFGETRILRLARAYEQATDWHGRRPHLPADAAKPALQPQGGRRTATQPADAADRAEALAAARHAGIAIDDRIESLLLQGVPFARAMQARLGRMHDRSVEPAVGLRAHARR